MRTNHDSTAIRRVFLVFFLLLISVQFISAQKKEINIETKPDTYAEFEGGRNAIAPFLGKSLKYPDLYKKYSVKARVIFQFIILADGTAADVKIIGKSGFSYDKELLEADFASGVIDEASKEKISSGKCFEEALQDVAKASPKWTPGIKDGQAVNSPSSALRIDFQPKK